MPLICAAACLSAALVSPPGPFEAGRQADGREIEEGIIDGVAYDDRGSGSPLVLLSATGLDRRLWDEQVEALARSHRVLRIDARGSGGSPPPSTPYDSRRDVLSVLQHEGLERVCLVGQSGAAARALDLALLEPDAVQALVLVAPGLSGFPFPPEEVERFAAMETTARERGHAAAVELMLEDPYFAGIRDRPELRPRVRALLLENDAMWDPRLVEHARPVAEPAVDRLDQVTVPTLVVIGDRDLPHIREIARKLAREIPEARLVEVEGAGHLVPLESPEPTTRAIRSFVDEHCSFD